MSEVFISYAWGSESEDIANALEQRFVEKGIKLIRDKTDLGYKGLIREFMQQLGQGKCVVVIISDKYLKSKNCMFELLEISRNGEFYDRIFPIVLGDARIYDVMERLNYIKYWEGKIDELEKGMREVSLANLQGFREEIDLYTEIRNKIAGLVDTLGNMNTLTPQRHQDSGFSEVIEAITKRLNEDSELPQSGKVQGTTIGNYAPNAQGSNIISGQNISGNTFVGTQHNYSAGQGSQKPQPVSSPAIAIWQEKLGYLQQQEAIASDPSVKFQLQKQIEECQEKIEKLED